MYCISCAEGSFDRIIYISRRSDNQTLKQYFLEAFGATSGSECERIVKRITNLLFDCGEDLTQIYELFYEKEYDSFSDFLENEERLSQTDITTLLKELKFGEDLWRINITDYETYNFLHLFDNSIWGEDSLNNIINIALKRCENENSK